MRNISSALYRLYKTKSLSNPKILINSIPKAGTNLLLQVFKNIPSLRDAGMGTITDLDWRMRGNPRRTLEECIDEISRIKNGEYQTAHLAYDERLCLFLKQRKIAHIFIVRDPRDIVVSAAFYILKESNDVFHDYFSSLKSDRERIIAIIKGVPGELVEDGLKLPSIFDFFRMNTPWLNDKNCLVLKFEDLIGPAGGGDETTQMEAVRKITRHSAIWLPQKKLATMAKEVFSEKSRTFRKGAIGGWTEWIDQELMAMLKEEKEVFRPFGYEI